MRNSKIFIAGVLGSLLIGASASAQLDKASQEALEKTKELLNDRAQRQKAIESNVESRKAHQSAAELAGSPENLDKMYQLSAKILERMANENKGNADQMQQKAKLGQQNPESFLSTMTPEERRMLKEITADVERRRGPSGLKH